MSDENTKVKEDHIVIVNCDPNATKVILSSVNSTSQALICQF